MGDYMRLFLRNRVTISGSILYFYSNGSSSITFHNDIFQENRVDNGQIVFVFTPPEKCLFNFTMMNVLFANNRVCKFSPFHLCAIVNFTVQCITANVDFKNLHFVGNLVQNGSCITFTFIKSALHFVTFDTCIFEKNIGFAMLLGGGDVVLTSKYLIFDSNRLEGEDATNSAVIALSLKNSTTRIMNTTVVNNFGRSFYSSCQTNTVLKIFDSAFVHNKIYN